MPPSKEFSLDLDNYDRFGFSMPENNIVKLPKGLSKQVVEEISRYKSEPEWMLKLRLKGLEYYYRKPLPEWGPDLSVIDFEDIHYYIKPSDKVEHDWDAVPKEIRETYDKLGIPEAEKKFLAGVGAQYESEVVYHSLQEQWSKLGVLFLDTDTGLREYPDIFKEYFAKAIPAGDNKLAALNTAVWSGGSFIYIPKGVHVTIPLQAYFRINAKNSGQFERTLIIADEGSSVHYVEGCTAPVYSSDSLHSAVVEIYVKKHARVRYTTIQNWSKNVYNLVTKRAIAEEKATMEWVDCNIGSKVTMKYPSVYMVGRGAKADILSVAYAGSGYAHGSGSKSSSRRSRYDLCGDSLEVHFARRRTERLIAVLVKSLKARRTARAR
jgi:Fe-S cluster assembly protein SufB